MVRGGVLRGEGARGAVYRSAPGGRWPRFLTCPASTPPFHPPSSVISLESPSAGLMPPAVPAPSKPRSRPARPRNLISRAHRTSIGNSFPSTGGHRTTRLHVAVPYRSCISSPGRLMLLLRSTLQDPQATWPRRHRKQAARTLAANSFARPAGPPAKPEIILYHVHVRSCPPRRKGDGGSGAMQGRFCRTGNPPNGSFLFLPCLLFWAAPEILPKNGRRPEGLLPRISRSPSFRCVWSPRPLPHTHFIGSRRGA